MATPAFNRKPAKGGKEKEDTGTCPVLDVGPENSSSYTSSELSESEEVALPLPPSAKAPVAVAKPPAVVKKVESSSSEVSSSDSGAEVPAAPAPGGLRLSPSISPARLREAMAGKRNVDAAILDRYHQVFCS